MAAGCECGRRRALRSVRWRTLGRGTALVGNRERHPLGGHQGTPTAPDSLGTGASRQWQLPERICWFAERTSGGPMAGLDSGFASIDTDAMSLSSMDGELGRAGALSRGARGEAPRKRSPQPGSARGSPSQEEPSAGEREGKPLARGALSRGARGEAPRKRTGEAEGAAYRSCMRPKSSLQVFFDATSGTKSGAFGSSHSL